MILVITLFIIWSMAIILLFMQSKEKTNIWFGGLLFIQGLGICEAIVEILIIPHAAQNTSLLWIIRRFLAALCFRFFPYFLIMAGVSYSGLIHPEWKKRLKFILFLPVMIAFGLDLIFIKEGFIYLDLPVSPLRWVTHIWAVPYYLFANYFFYQEYRIETNKQKRIHKLLIFIVLAFPTMLIMLATVTIAPSQDWWQYLLAQSLMLIGVFLFFLGKFGFDGFKLRLEKEYQNGTISGVTVISHTVKNEVSKIHCYVDAAKNGLSDPVKALENIDMAAGHMDEIIDRIGKHLHDFEIKCAAQKLLPIIDDLVATLEPVFKAKKITVIKEYQADPVVCCDKTHITEVMNNILINAIEAIDTACGKIFIELNAAKNQVTLIISDNGVGIRAENLSRLTNLFYSTKTSDGKVRGTGLHYCASVIAKHHGELNFRAQAGIGTTVEIKLPL